MKETIIQVQVEEGLEIFITRPLKKDPQEIVILVRRTEKAKKVLCRHRHTTRKYDDLDSWCIDCESWVVQSF